MKNKKAAMEMSVGTLVTIVLLVAVLGLGIYLITQIGKGATDSVNTINDRVKSQLNDLLVGEKDSASVLLPSDKKAKIERDTPDFGVAIAAEIPDGSAATRDKLQYKLSLDEDEKNNCLEILGKERTEDLMKQRTEEYISFDAFEGPNAYGIISFNIPPAITKCAQKIYVDVREAGDSEPFAGLWFKIEII